MRFAVRNGGQSLAQLQSEVGRLFDDLFAAPRSRMAGLATRAFPPLNLWQQDDRYVLEAEVPGVKSDDLDISVVGDRLTLKGRRAPSQMEGQQCHRQERGAGEFSRVIQLPSDVNSDAVEATLVDGVLTVRLPKAEAAKPRKISVSGGSQAQA